MLTHSKKMKNLRFLKFNNTLGQRSSSTYLDLPATLEPFSDKLRYLEWIGYPFESLPSCFCAKLLAEIHMPHSKLKRLWQGMQVKKIYKYTCLHLILKDFPL